MARTPTAAAERVVTATPIAGSTYVSIECSWEDEPRKTPIAEWTVQRFAEGWKAELVWKAAW